MITQSDYDFHEQFPGSIFSVRAVGEFENVAGNFTLEYRFNTEDEKKMFCSLVGTSAARVILVDAEGKLGDSAAPGCTIRFLKEGSNYVRWQVTLGQPGDYFIIPEGSYFTGISGIGALVRYQ